MSALVAGEAERLRALMLLRLFKLLRLLIFIGDVDRDALLKVEVNAEGEVAVVVGCKKETETGPRLGVLMLERLGIDEGVEDESKLAMVGKRAGFAINSAVLVVGGGGGCTGS